MFKLRFCLIVGSILGAMAFAGPAMALTCPGTTPANATPADAAQLTFWLSCNFAPLVNGNIPLGTGTGLATYSVTTATTNGSDFQGLSIAGGGTALDTTRGGYVGVFGNDDGVFNLYGAVLVGAGQATGGIGGSIIFSTDPTNGSINNPVTRMTITNGGNIGIGTTAPAEALAVNGAVQFGNTVIGAPVNTYASGRIGSYSGGYEFVQPALNHALHVWSSNSNDIAIFGKAGSPTDTTTYLAGNVGVGTASPSTKLDVQGGYIRAQDSGAASGAFMQGSNGQSYFGNLGTADVYIGNSANWSSLVVKNGGFVGIGTTSPTDALTVANGNIRAIGTGNSILSLNANLGWGSTATAPSSQPVCFNAAFSLYIPAPCASLSQYKKNQHTLSLGLDTAMKLHPVEFDWDKQHGGHHDLGFIAQEVEQVSPLLAEYDYKDDPKGKLISVKYMQMTALLTKAVQELKSANDAQAARDANAQKAIADTVRALQAQNERLEAIVEKQQAQIGALARANAARATSNERSNKFGRLGATNISARSP